MPARSRLRTAGQKSVDRIVLRATVVPDGDAVGPPAESHLVLGDARLAEQVLQQVGGARRVVLADAHVRGRVEVAEVRGEAPSEQDLLAGLGMRAHHRMLGVGELGVQRQALLSRHRRAETGLDAVRARRPAIWVFMGSGRRS